MSLANITQLSKYFHCYTWPSRKFAIDVWYDTSSSAYFVCLKIALVFTDKLLLLCFVCLFIVCDVVICLEDV